MISSNLRGGWICVWALAVAGAGSSATAQVVYAPQAEGDVRVFRVGTERPSFIGVGIKEIDSERAKQLKLREEAGVEVTRVEEESPAAKAGVKVGDVILQYNGQRVEGMEQLSRMIRETPPGREVRVALSRDGNAETVTIRVGQRKSSFGAGGVPAIAMPRIEIPVIPDIPRTLMMWRSSALGVEAEPLRGQLAEYFGVKDGGVLVRSVMKESAAEKAGIRAGDVILRVNDQKVASPNEIASVLRGMEGKKPVPVVLMRDRKETTVTATIDSESEDWMRPARAPRPRAVRM